MRQSFPAVRGLMILTSVLFAARTLAGEPDLEFRLGGKFAAKVSLGDLQDKIKSHRVRFFNVLMNKEKTYEAFALKDVLNFAYQTKWGSDHYSDIAFIASDGYEAVSSLGKLQEDGGFLAFRDLDLSNGWEPVGNKKVDPAPFFLIWTGKNQTPQAAYPWPWQVVALDLLRFEEQYPAIVPKGAPIESAAYRGFELFRTRCLRCHAMDQQGGKLGPDLNAPQNITAYRSKPIIKEFIKHPSTYRYSPMPDNPDLSARNLEDLYQYFRFQRERKAKEHEEVEK